MVNANKTPTMLVTRLIVQQKKIQQHWLNRIELTFAEAKNIHLSTVMARACMTHTQREICWSDEWIKTCVSLYDFEYVCYCYFCFSSFSC